MALIKNVHLPASPEPSLKAARVAVLCLFGLNGWLYASWAARIPEIQTLYGLDDAKMGLVLITASAGAFVIMPFAASIIGRIGLGKTNLISALLYVVAVPLIPWFSEPVALFSIYAAIGVGFGLLDVAMNTQAVEIERAYKRSILSSFHAGFSAAMIAGALAASLVITLQLSFELHLGIAAVVALGLAVYSYPRLLPDEVLPDASDAAPEPAFRLPVRATWLIGAIGFCSMMSEASISDWSAKYMLEVAKSREVFAPWAIAAFSVTMTTGRIFGDGLRDRFGNRGLLQMSTAVALVGMLITLAFPYPAVVVLGAAAVGMGLSVAVPIVFSLSGQVPGIGASAALAMVTTISYIGLFLGPAIIGFLAEHFGLRIGYAYIAGALGIMLLLVTRVADPAELSEPAK